MTTRKIRPRPRRSAYVPISEPRPDASKIVAAKQRAQPGRPAHDTEPITPLRSDAPILRRQLLVPIGVVGCVLVAAILFTRLPSVSAPTALAITPSIVPTNLPAALSVPTATPEAVETQMVVAYTAPNGEAFPDSINITNEHAVPVARYGDAWVQLQRADATRIWVTTHDVPVEARSLASLPDLQPFVAAQPPQSGQGLTLYQDSAQPPTAPLPEATAAPTAVVWPTSAPARAADFVQPRASDTCKFIGCLPGGDLARQADVEQACHALFWQYGDIDADAAGADSAAVRDCMWKVLYK